MKNVKFNKMAVAIASVLVAGATYAADSGSGQLNVSANIAAECTVAQNVAVNFSNLHMLNGAAQSSSDDVASGSVNAICTNGTPSPQFRYTSANNGFQLKGGTDATQLISYSLYQNDTATGSAVSYNTDVAHPDFVADGTAKLLHLSARIIPADKNGKLVQAYSDTITVTTSFTL